MSSSTAARQRLVLEKSLRHGLVLHPEATPQALERTTDQRKLSAPAGKAMDLSGGDMGLAGKALTLAGKALALAGEAMAQVREAMETGPAASTTAVRRSRGSLSRRVTETGWSP